METLKTQTVRKGRSGIPTIFMAMPETTMDKNHGKVFALDDIWGIWEFFYIHPKTEPFTKKLLSYMMGV